MHYHCEIVIPPTDDITKSVTSVLEPFDENLERDSEIARGSPFWDWWVIGGRWAGAKLIARFDPKKLKEFYQWMTDEKITVSGLRCGKEELSPASQIPKVDNKWNEMFPSENFVPCPLFMHSNNPYGKDYSPLMIDKYGTNPILPDDIMLVKDLPTYLTCERVIIGGLNYKEDGIEPKFMLVREEWNGLNHMIVKWNGNIKTAIKQYINSLRNYKEDYKKKVLPKNDWLVVTVDYHS